MIIDMLFLAFSAVVVDQWFGSQRRQRDFYQILSDLGQLFSSQAEPDELLKTILKESAEVLRASWGEVILKINGQYQRKAVLGEARSVSLPMDSLPEGRQTLADKVIAEGKSYLVRDLEMDLRFSRWYSTRPRIHSFMVVPIRKRGKPFGLLALGNKMDGFFTHDDLAMLEAIVAKSETALDNALLLKEREERVIRLAVLNEIAQAISSVLDTEELLHTVYKQLGRLMDVTNFYIALYNPEEEEINFVLAIQDGQMLGWERLERSRRRMVPGRGLTEYIIQTKKPLLLVHNLEEEVRCLGIEPVGRPAKSWLGVPMMVRNKVIGVMAVQDYEHEYAYTQEDLEVLQSVANQTAIALENARLLEQTDEALARKVRELTSLREIDRELAMASLDLNRVFELVVDRAVAATGASAGVLAILEEKEAGRGLYLKAQRGYPEAISYYSKHPYPIDKGITGYVARTGQARLCPNIAEEPDYDSIIESTKSQLSVPIVLEKKVLGVITLESSREGAFTESDLNFIQQLADRAAIAIRQARLYEEARKASESQSEFISIVSHELRTPMTNIKGYTDLILSGRAGPISERQKEFLTRVRSNVQRMASLVEDLLNISRIEAGKLRLEIEPVHIAEVVEEVVNFVQQEVREKKLLLRLDIKDALPPVKADRSRVLQILSNLLSNACSYTPPEGSITIRAYKKDGFIQVDVADTGIGIPPEEQPKIFQRFFRGSHPLVKEKQGTGLGLYITKSLVELLGGQIWFQSEPGKGTTFSFILPVWSEKR